MTNLKWVLLCVPAFIKFCETADDTSIARVMRMFADFINGKEIDFRPLSDLEYDTIRALIKQVEDGLGNWRDYSKNRR